MLNHRACDTTEWRSQGLITDASIVLTSMPSQHVEGEDIDLHLFAIRVLENEVRYKGGLVNATVKDPLNRFDFSPRETLLLRY